MTGHGTPYDRSNIDELLAEHFRSEAPHEAPSWLLRAVQDRIGGTPQKGGSRGAAIARGLAVAAVLVLAVGAALIVPDLLGRRVGVVPTSSPEPSDAPSASVEPSPSLVASAEPTASPSASASDSAVPPGDTNEIVLVVTSVCDVAPPLIMPVIVVSADGRAVWSATTDEGLASEYQTRRLSASGLAKLRDQLATTELFEEDARYEVDSLPDVEPPGMGGCLNTFTYRDGGSVDPVVVESGAWYGDDLESEFFVPSPERRTLNELLAAVRDPEAMLGEEAWDTAREPFVPDEYVVIAAPTVLDIATLGAPDVDDVTWPFDAPPGAFGDAVTDTTGNRRCGIADAGRVRAFADQLVAAGLEQFAGTFVGAGAVLPWASRDAALDVGMWPVIADGSPACDDTP